jgi:hypothetical protein
VQTKLPEEVLVALAETYLLQNPGKDFYSYLDDPHFYGTKEMLMQFISEIYDEMEHQDAECTNTGS